MSNLMKKVRIVHSPEERRYYVEEKSVWGLRWKKSDSYAYVDMESKSAYGSQDSDVDAFTKAKKRAETLLARTVVWEQTNYFWGG